MDDLTGATVNSARREPPVDLLNLDMDFEFMSAERRQQLMAPISISNEEAPRQYPQFNDVSMEVVAGSEVNVRQDKPYGTNHDEQARIGRDCQSFDVAPAPRPIKAHRRRRSRHRVYNPPCRRSDYHTPGYANYFDRDAVRSQRDYYSPSRGRNASIATLKQKSEPTFIAAMADLDVKEERDYDRRGTDSYRGGGNKRRRDGELITQQYSASQ